jgi:mono/diheme cytochrome c family protein
MCWKRSPLWASALLVVTALGATAQEREGADAQAARLFEQSCASCHVVPDAKFETDRAWLGQLPKTA